MAALEHRDYKGTLELIASSFTDGWVVPFLGAGVNLTDRPKDYRWGNPQAPFLPSGGELARYVAGVAGFFGDDQCIARDCLKHAERCALAGSPPNAPAQPCRPDTCALKGAGLDLAHVTQFLMAKADELEVYRTLRSVFARRFEPTTAHRYIASLLHSLGHRAKIKPLVVTTNYDDLMETAFAELGQPFDLVFYEAKRGKSQGRFFHTGPTRPEPVVTGQADKYAFLTSHPVILKIHGHVNQSDHDGDSYVITEDDYIQYLSNLRLKQLLPATILEALLQRRLLFLGYSLRDWNLRVFLRRLAADQELRTKRWAVSLGFSPEQRRVWAEQRDLPIEIIDAPMAEFIAHLKDAIDGRLQSSATGS